MDTVMIEHKMGGMLDYYLIEENLVMGTIMIDHIMGVMAIMI